MIGHVVCPSWSAWKTAGCENYVGWLAQACRRQAGFVGRDGLPAEVDPDVAATTGGRGRD